jgi:hypothetical protein
MTANKSIKYARIARPIGKSLRASPELYASRSGWKVNPMNLLKGSLIAVCVIALLGCERQANLKQRNTYEKDGLSFLMPANWRVTDDQDDHGFRYLSVETPGNAIIVMNVYPLDQSEPFKQYVETLIESSRKELMSLASIKKERLFEIETKLEDRTLAGFKSEFVASLVGIDVPHQMVFYSFRSDARIAYVSCQVAVEDLSKVEKGFELVLSTFRLQ